VTNQARQADSGANTGDYIARLSASSKTGSRPFTPSIFMPLTQHAIFTISFTIEKSEESRMVTSPTKYGYPQSQDQK
jgi:hypothetical protein